jgi:hypothetical protein
MFLLKQTERNYEARLENLAPLVQKEITNGFLDLEIDSPSRWDDTLPCKYWRKGSSRKGQTAGKSGESCSRQIWRDEVRVFRNKEYQYVV